MSIFTTIMNKIFHHGQAAPATSGAAPAPHPAPAHSAAPPPAQAAAPAPAQPVDVEAVLSQIAAQKGRPSNWKTSIVDLLTLLDMDPSLAARKELANELNIHVGADGSAKENIALHKAVMAKLAANGGKVPADLRD